MRRFTWMTTALLFTVSGMTASSVSGSSKPKPGEGPTSEKLLHLRK